MKVFRDGGRVRLPIYGESSADRLVRVFTEDVSFGSWLRREADDDFDLADEIEHLGIDTRSLSLTACFAALPRTRTKGQKTGMVRAAMRLFLSSEIPDAGRGHVCIEEVSLNEAPEGGGVYVLRQGVIGPFKIGVARNIRRRLWHLQMSSGYPLHFIGELSGAREEERRLHEAFGHLRLHGEWFAPSQELLDLARWNPPGRDHGLSRRTRTRIALGIVFGSVLGTYEHQDPTELTRRGAS